MEKAASKWINIFVESINYILIAYALSNMALVFQRNVLFILFFASEVWVTGNYWKKVYEATQNKMLSAALMVTCFIVHMGGVYFVGRFVGDIIPFRQ